MLCADGARGGSTAGIEQAIFAYNHADWYVTEVMSWAGKYAAQGGTARRDRDRVRDGPARQAVPVGRRRPGRLRLLRPDLRRLRRRRNPHRPHHLPVAAGRPRRPAVPAPARRPAVLRGHRRHRDQPRSRRHVPRLRPGHPGTPDRRGRPDRPPRPGQRRRRHPPRRPGPGHDPITRPTPAQETSHDQRTSSPAAAPPAPPAAAARAVSDAARAAAGAWAQPMDPAESSRAISQLYSVLRDLGIATRGLARYQTTGHPGDPRPRTSRGSSRRARNRLLDAGESLDGVLAAEGLGPVPDPDEPGAVLCRAARNAISAWRQPAGPARTAIPPSSSSSPPSDASPLQRCASLHTRPGGAPSSCTRGRQPRQGDRLPGLSHPAARGLPSAKAWPRRHGRWQPVMPGTLLFLRRIGTSRPGKPRACFQAQLKMRPVRETQPVPAADILDVTWDLPQALRDLGIALRRLSRYRPETEPDG